MNQTRAWAPSAWLMAYPILVAAAEVTAAAWVGAGLFAVADPVSLAVLVLSGVSAFVAVLSTRRRDSQRTTIESRAQTTAEHAQRLDELQATITSVSQDRAYWEQRATRAEAALATERGDHLVTRGELHHARRETTECEARLEVAVAELAAERARTLRNDEGRPR